MHTRYVIKYTKKMDSTAKIKSEKDKTFIYKCFLENNQFDTKPSNINSNICNNTEMPCNKEFFFLAYPYWEITITISKQ